MREVIANLTQLQVLLPAEEKPLLQAHIDSLTKIQDRLQQRSLSSSTLYTLKREVEQIYRKLVKGFSPQSRKRVEDSEKVSSGTK
jgi:recombinational DNA repair protein (RecF pathway)